MATKNRAATLQDSTNCTILLTVHSIVRCSRALTEQSRPSLLSHYRMSASMWLISYMKCIPISFGLSYEYPVSIFSNPILTNSNCMSIWWIISFLSQKNLLLNLFAHLYDNYLRLKFLLIHYIYRRAESSFLSHKIYPF